jgi:hypothetical protein
MNFRSNPSLAIVCLVLAAAVPAMVLASGGPSSPKGGEQGAAVPPRTAGQKPGGSGVVVQYQVGATPQPGQPTAVVLQFDGVTAPDGATVQLTPDSGLSLQGSATLTLPQGRSTATVRVASERQGLAYLNLFISQSGASSVVSIPIQTGGSAPALKSTGELKTTPDGERIITLPVK